MQKLLSQTAGSADAGIKNKADDREVSRLSAFSSYWDIVIS